MRPHVHPLNVADFKGFAPDRIFGSDSAAIATQRILAVLRAPSGGGSSTSTTGMGVKRLAANVVLASRELGMSNCTENAWRAIKGRDFES